MVWPPASVHELCIDLGDQQHRSIISRWANAKVCAALRCSHLAGLLHSSNLTTTRCKMYDKHGNAESVVASTHIGGSPRIFREVGDELVFEFRSCHSHTDPLTHGLCYAVTLAPQFASSLFSPTFATPVQLGAVPLQQVSYPSTSCQTKLIHRLS